MSDYNIKYEDPDRRGSTKGANQVTLPGQSIPLRPEVSGDIVSRHTAVVSGLDHVSGYKDNIEYWIRTMVRDPEKTARLLDLLERRWFEDGTSGEGNGTRLVEASDGQRVMGKESDSDRTSEQPDAVLVEKVTTNVAEYKGKDVLRHQELEAHRPVILECTRLDDTGLPSDTITPVPVENRAKQDDGDDETSTGCCIEEAGPAFPSIDSWRETADECISFEGEMSLRRVKGPQNSAKSRIGSARPRMMWIETTKITAASLKSLPLLVLSISISLCFRALLVAEILKDMLRLPFTGVVTSQEAHSIS